MWNCVSCGRPSVTSYCNRCKDVRQKRWDWYTDEFLNEPTQMERADPTRISRNTYCVDDYELMVRSLAGLDD